MASETPFAAASLGMSVRGRPDLSAEMLQRLLLYGSDASRQRLAERIARSGDGLAGQLAVLAETIRSDAPAGLRARCLEVLKLAADQLWADREAAINEN